MTKGYRRSCLPVLFLAFLLPVGGASAATFTVTSLADSGLGSLRQAVLDANVMAGADEVAFAPGVSGMITLTSGEIAISDSLVVHGPGLGLLTVDGNAQSRIFYVENPSTPAPIDVTLSGLTLTRGAGLPVHSPSFGGAVFANGENLTILNSVISDSAPGLLTSPPDGCGGNVALNGLNGETLRIVNTLVTGGIGAGAGGNLCVMNGRLLVEGSTFSNGHLTNTVGSGGGLFLQSSASDNSIVLSTVTSSAAGFTGGGIHAQLALGGALTIDSSTISINTSALFGRGGGFYLDGGSARILNSTIWGNDSNGGGGIYAQNTDLQIVNSTISENNAHTRGGGVAFVEGENGSLLLRLTTVSDNRALAGAASLYTLDLSAPDVVQLDHAILANGGPDDLPVFAPLPPITANYSLIETPGDTVLIGAHNLVGIDPLLGPLADNGGPTMTHRLLPGSPALSTGDPSIPSPPATDQRGFPRVVGPAIDRGAVEQSSEAVEVPTLSEVGLVALCTTLLAVGLRRMRRPLPL